MANSSLLLHSRGRFMTARFRSSRATAARPVPFEAAEYDLLRTHVDYGCISIWCMTPERAHAFAFLPRLVKGIVPCAQLVYCRDIKTFTRFARPVGRYLALRGRPLTIIDANGPIPNLVGKYVPGKLPKYFKGQGVRKSATWLTQKL